ARDESAVGRYVYNTLLMKLVLSLVLDAAALGLAFAIGIRGEGMALIAVYCVSLVAVTLANTVVAGLQGMQRMGHVAAAAAAGVILSNVLGLVVLFRHGSLVLFAVASTVGAWIPLFANLK